MEWLGVVLCSRQCTQSYLWRPCPAVHPQAAAWNVDGFRFCYFAGAAAGFIELDLTGAQIRFLSEPFRDRDLCPAACCGIDHGRLAVPADLQGDAESHDASGTDIPRCSIRGLCFGAFELDLPSVHQE